MDFEFDPAKSQANLEKHGIDFTEAQKLWADEDRLVIPAQSETEDRFALLGRQDDRIWAAFYTMRGEAVRIISVRRARENEIELYES